MDNKELYLSWVEKRANDIPYGLAFYAKRKPNGNIDMGNYIHLEFRNNDKVIEQSLKEMAETEKKEGFMFWAGTNQAKEFVSQINNPSDWILGFAGLETK